MNFRPHYSLYILPDGRQFTDQAVAEAASGVDMNAHQWLDITDMAELALHRRSRYILAPAVLRDVRA